MKQTESQQQSIVNILLRYWGEITAIEEPLGLKVGKGDIRPRIDYFHDAVRAFTSGAPQDRLTVEKLSYDVKCLRYIASVPMASITHDENLSASSQLITTGPMLVEQPKKLSRDTRARLKELYDQYGVLFSSLFREAAEEDYLDRTEELNHEVEQVNQLIAAITRGASTQEITTLINHLADEQLRRDLLLLIPQMKGKSAGALDGLIARLKANIQKNDKRIKGVDGAYHGYVTSQLALYENGKDMLKKMAGQGMNLVGQFVETAIKGSERGRGR